jgi:hypothetical protein
MLSRFLFALAVLFLGCTSALAVSFRDIPLNYAHEDAVAGLSALGVITGNPDGTFKPHDPVNRVAMLAMLYRAAKKTPSVAVGCFSDLEPSSWYESTVCDAAAKGFVQGYSGGVFKPDQPVTRAEAIKLAISVLGVAAAEPSSSDHLYSDIGASDWHAPFVRTALARNILPIPGQDGSTLRPHQVLERGEAAAYIWNALAAKAAQPVSSAAGSSSSGSSEAESSAPSAADLDLETRAAAALRVMQQEEEALKRAAENTKSVLMPFTDKNQFSGKEPFSYQFSLSNSVTAEIVASIADAAAGGMTCRLYHLGRSGFTQEYYLGFRDGNHCTIRATLGAGKWRLQLEPEQLSPSFTVVAKLIKGDGNDGFSQAAMLPIGQAITDSLDSGDLEDWFTFSVPKDAKTVEKGGRELLMRVISSELLGCIIYPLDDVDMFGFTGPDCGKAYRYPPGTYMVGVRHAVPYSMRMTYSVQVK